MSLTDFQNKACETARRLLDSYASGELSGRSKQKTHAHLASCARCSALLDERRRVTNLLRRAVRRDVAPRRLVCAIRTIISQP